jgi:hypothetical protein
MSPQTFYPFKRLPAELQIDIWQHAINAVPSRVVNIRRGAAPFIYESRPQDDFRRAAPQESDQYTSSSPIPSLLHACQDSREVASRRWQLAFPRLDNCPKIFFDYEHDILWVGDQRWDLGLFVREVCAHDANALYKLRKIALDIDNVRECGPEEAYFWGGWSMAKAIHRDMPLLDEIVLIGYYTGELDDFRDPRKTRVRLTKAAEDDIRLIRLGGYGDDLIQFRALYARKKWHCPEFMWMGWVMEENGSRPLPGEDGS